MALGEADLASLTCLAMTPTILVGLENQRRYWVRLAILIDGDVGDVGARSVLPLARQNVFGKNLHADFHRSVKDAIHTRLQGNEVAHTNRKPEVEIVHRSSNHMAVRMAVSGECPGHIDQVHHATAQHGAERIGVVREDHLDHLRA